MSGSLITAIVGAVAAVVAASIVSLFSFRKTAAETAKLRAETDKIRRETAEMDSQVANAETMARDAYQTLPPRRSVTLYDSRELGFSLFDFEASGWDFAAGELALAPAGEASDRVLVMIRPNTAGSLVAWLSRYGYRDDPSVIPVGPMAAARRRFRVQCQVRAHDAEHTFLLVFKMTGAPQHEYLGQRRHRIAPGAWTDIDDHFELAFGAVCRLRLVDRNVSAAPSRLEIRNLVVTEHEPPKQLVPAAG